MTLPEPPISIDETTMTRGDVIVRTGDKVRVKGRTGVFKQFSTDARGGVYMQCIVDGRSYYHSCSEVTPG